MSAYHTPVLLQESITALSIRENGVYVDATFGGGGHSREILRHLGPEGRLIAFDKDEEALANAPEDERLVLVHNDFRFVHHYVRYYGHDAVDGILADLGVSSHQFDTEERGFSFRFENAPLDMRMNVRAGKSAADIVNSYSGEDLERIFRLYGEVESSRRLAELIVSSRDRKPLETTEDLGRAIAPVLPKFLEHKYLAKVYQALRIEVNGEMTSLEGFMKGAIRSLGQGGRLAVITYHSLEDRIVKNAIREGCQQGLLQRVAKKPILPSEEEISSNTRARSAKLRVAGKQ
ncbi:MAG: 16S rRNA (cytosine(1402)-N(4))-methyltransferase RsmH [Bacteroidales bacterium]|jgi:16S rRNA (cytosine1402-N4)-methyltransferase|nr:16S rRNA (cytosine(1402)-N(4))-methyltransferase RsmH [Bacteroidales bacterium]